MKLVAAFVLVASLGPGAQADGILVKGDYPRLDVVVGKTSEANVHAYRGYWGCDDPNLVTADLVTRGDSNFWIVKGVKAGSTQCRVGLEQYGGYMVFDVYVIGTASSPKATK